MLVLLACAAALSCRDAPHPGAPPASPPATAARLLGSYECSVDMAAGRLACRETGEPARPGDPRRTGPGSGQVRLASAHLRSDARTGIVSADVTVQNLLAQPLGTPDGVAASGIKVFFETGPSVTSYATPGDTGTVTVANADGVANLTGPSQPYHLYDRLLRPNEVSAAKRWDWRVPRTVKTFTFAIRVFAAVPGGKEVPSQAPDSVPAWVYGSANLTHDDSPSMAGSFPRNVVFVDFRPGATGEEKQAAIALIGGEVIGGRRLTGTYAVRVQDDGTPRALFTAIRTLAALPQVASAVPDPVLTNPGSP